MVRTEYSMIQLLNPGTRTGQAMAAKMGAELNVGPTIEDIAEDQAAADAEFDSTAQTFSTDTITASAPAAAETDSVVLSPELRGVVDQVIEENYGGGDPAAAWYVDVSE